MAFFLQGNLQKTQLSIWTSLNQVLMNACFSYFSEQALPGLGDWWQFQSAANNRICFIICSLHLFKRKTLACKNEYAWLNLHSLQRHCCLPLSLLTSARAVGFISTMVPNVTPIFEESGLLVFFINHCNYLARHHQEEPWIVTRLHLSCVQKKTMNICWESFKGGADLSPEHPPAIKWFANAFIISILCALTFDEE